MQTQDRLILKHGSSSAYASPRRRIKEAKGNDVMDSRSAARHEAHIRSDTDQPALRRNRRDGSVPFLRPYEPRDLEDMPTHGEYMGGPGGGRQHVRVRHDQTYHYRPGGVKGSQPDFPKPDRVALASSVSSAQALAGLGRHHQGGAERAIPRRRRQPDDGGVIRDESDTSTRLDTLRIEYEDRLLGEGDTYP